VYDGKEKFPEYGKRYIPVYLFNGKVFASLGTHLALGTYSKYNFFVLKLGHGHAYESVLQVAPI
jgi:hypothetical protein